jgi:hypothetical protein
MSNNLDNGDLADTNKSEYKYSYYKPNLVEKTSKLYRKGRQLFKSKTVSNADYYDFEIQNVREKTSANFDFSKMTTPMLTQVKKNNFTLTTDVAPVQSTLASTNRSSSASSFKRATGREDNLIYR